MSVNLNTLYKRGLMLCLAVLLLSLSPLAVAKSTKIRIKNWQTANGAQVYFVHAPEIPMVDIKVVYAAGSSRDEQQFGLASLTNSMLEEGTQQYSADQIAEQLDAVGAKLHNNVSRDMAGVSLRSLTDPTMLEPALKVFTQVLTQASFPEKAFNRDQKNTLIAIQHQQQSPGRVASIAFYHALYKNHPYAHAVIGNSDTVKQLTRNDLQAFYHQYYVAKNATIAIVGAVDTAQAKRIADQITAHMPAGDAAIKLPDSAMTTHALNENIKFPSSQTQIRMGQVGISRHSADYFPLYVGNYILGGGMLVSRLNEEIREKHGLSYSIYSYFHPLAENGPFLISLGTRNAQSHEALKLTRETLKAFIEEGPTPQELTAAKKNIIGSFPLKIASNSQIANYLVVIGFYKLPLNYLQRFPSKIRAVTLKQIKQAFRQRVHPSQMVTVSVGKSPQARR